jgi:hypothetical protein
MDIWSVKKKKKKKKITYYLLWACPVLDGRNTTVCEIKALLAVVQFIIKHGDCNVKR